jgi:FkbM family methyltransferase
VSAILPAIVTRLLREIDTADAGPELLDNFDLLRFGEGYDPLPPDQAPERLAGLLSISAGLQALSDRLGDEADRELLIRVLAYRVLGHRKVQLPLTAAGLRRLTERVHTVRTAQKTAPLGIFGAYADDFDLNALGYPIRLRGTAGAVIQTYELEQYRCPGPREVAVNPGDLVIDGGAYWGDTALYFAHRAGPGGRVVSFEFEASNLAGLEHNLRLNPQLADRIEVIPAALWDEPGQTVSVRAFGPTTAIDAGGDTHAPTDTIDALVARGAVDRVDFIKLDVEGAELNALRGAQATLLRFRPRLAIAAYHRLDDLSAIPAYLMGLDVGYLFRLGHTTMHAEETVLFAFPDSAGPPGTPACRGDRWRRTSSILTVRAGDSQLARAAANRARASTEGQR